MHGESLLTSQIYVLISSKCQPVWHSSGAYISSPTSSSSVEFFAQIMALNYLKHHSRNDPNSVKAVVYILGLVTSVLILNDAVDISRRILATLVTTFSSHQIYDIFITKMGTVELLDEIILYVGSIPISGVTSDCEIIALYPFVVSVAIFPSRCSHARSTRKGKYLCCVSFRRPYPTIYAYRLTLTAR